jgi:probable F420-dependent oxidoreductase
VKIGLVFPQTEVGNDVEAIRDFAIGTESGGFEFLAAYDHVAGHRPSDPEHWRTLGPYTDADAFHEVFVLFSYLAAITTKIELVTEVLVLPQRQTVLVAKQAAELQLLSRGRFRLGIGVGWNPEEYRALGMSFHDRGKRVAEQVALLRQLWGQPLVSHDGPYHSLHNMGLNPRPESTPIPIWIGGSSSIALKRAATIADGFAFDHSIKEAPAVLKELKGYLEQAHRGARDFGLAARVRLGRSIEDLLAEAAAWQALGITHLSLNTMNSGLSGPAGHLEAAVKFLAEWQNRSGD